MSKIDEVAELLIEEINEFKKTTDDLKELIVYTNSKASKVDLSPLNDTINKLFSAQRQMSNTHYSKIKNILLGMKPKPKKNSQAIKISVLSLGALVFAVLGYALIAIKQLPEIKAEEYNKGEKRVLNHFLAFFEANPKAKKTYDLWIDNYNK